VEQASQIREIAASLDRLEGERSLPPGAIRLCATLETPGGILAAVSVASAPRMAALAFGAEDLSAAMGVRPTTAFARAPGQAVALAASARGLESWGLAGSISEFTRRSVFERAVAVSKAIGLTTILCIHPAQVEIASRVYRPTPAEAAWARNVASAYEAAKASGVGSIAVDGRMIDEPIYLRATRLLSRLKERA
jgi:citrate lyase subunit beta/citryl-CoA lyase